ncbi:MAG: hypothetical protein NT069_29615, partial [Planctomycetota bacterium]|nr:hypothetical protein [Planctomycetota bacterium]
TDRIIDRFWRIRPPAFATLSATVRLPIASFTESAGDLHALRLKLRDIEQHPERFLDQPTSPQAETLVLEKRRLIAEQEAARVGRLSPGAGAWYAPAAGRERYRRLQAISRELAQFTGKCRQELMARLAETERRVSANVVLRNREYAFCLYPASKLRSFFEHVCHAVR